MIVSGSQSQVLASRLAEETGQALAPVSYDRFPDGELYVKVSDPDVERAVVVASTSTSDAHVELLQIQDALREAGVSEIVTVVPFLGYARRDYEFEPGRPVSARAVARAISTGADRVVTVNPYDPDIVEAFDVPATVVDAAGRLADPLPDDLREPLFLAPDADVIDLAESLRDAYGRGDVDHFEKTRHSTTEVDIEPRSVDPAGRDVVLIDDVIATGSTMAASVGVLDELDAGRVFATCVHPILTRNAVLELSEAGVEEICGTDTIERIASVVSVAEDVADAL